MYTFELTDRFLSEDERDIFGNFLEYQNLDKNIWEVFSCLFKSGVKNTEPLLLKVFKNSELCGATVLIKCSKYGNSLFNNKFLSRIINLFKIPFYLWIKFGCCMDMMSNPGFVKNPEQSAEIYSAMVMFMKKSNILTIICDYTENASLYPESSILPALPHALINTSNMTGIQDYICDHKNIKRKMNNFRNKGGEFIQVNNMLNKSDITSLKKCFISTAENSVFYLPYQDIYLNSALTTSATNLKNVYYFLAKLNGEFIGYQAVIKTGDCLNALHGAFDRNLKTTYHAYDI